MRKWKKCALAAVLAALCALSTACGIIGGDEEQGPVDNVKVSDA